MRTIFVRVTDEPALSYAPVSARLMTSTTFTIDRPNAAYADAALEFQAGETVRCRLMRLRGPDEETPRQRMVAVERLI